VIDQDGQEGAGSGPASPSLASGQEVKMQLCVDLAVVPQTPSQSWMVCHAA